MARKRRRKHPNTTKANATGISYPTESTRIERTGRRIYIRRSDSSPKPESSSERRYRELRHIAHRAYMEFVNQPLKARRRLSLTLESKRSKRFDVSDDCSRCQRYRQPLWFFAKSNRGPVFLCTSCKEITRDPFKKVDVMDRAVLVGAVEMNRRRH